MVSIIIEGPDGSGKTYLAGQLCEELGLDYHHEGIPPTDRTIRDHYIEVLMAHPQHVLDRSATGEAVYGAILRGTSRFSSHDVKRWARLTKWWGVPTVLCLPSFESCLAAWSRPDRSEHVPDEGALRKTYDRWEFLSNSMGAIVYDWQRDPVGGLVQRLVDKTRGQQ